MTHILHSVHLEISEKIVVFHAKCVMMMTWCFHISVFEPYFLKQFNENGAKVDALFVVSAAMSAVLFETTAHP